MDRIDNRGRTPYIPFTSRNGKVSLSKMADVATKRGHTQIVTPLLFAGRIRGGEENILDPMFQEGIALFYFTPNTSGARNAKEAVRIRPPG
ncbi:MAG: hypothetical protein ACLR23_28455 [Clostridia bacterium]